MTTTLLDIEALAKPLGEEAAPCGPSLEYDQEYVSLFRDAEGLPEREIGSSFVPAEPPDWADVHRRALELLSRSRDLRLMALLTSAQISTHGFSGLRAGLELIQRSLVESWDHLHPQLDPEDNHDPTMRMNALAELSPSPGSGNPLTHVVRRVRDIPLTDSRALGRFSLRDIAVARGEAAPPASRNGDGAPAAADMAQIDGAFQSTGIEKLQETAAAAKGCIEVIRAIDAELATRVGSAAKPDLTPLQNAVSEATAALEQQLARRGVGSNPTDEEGSPDGAASDGAAQQTSGEIRTRDDVLKTLDRVLRYYETHEPSSPVPLLVRRAKRLVHMTFDQIVQDLAPDALSAVRRISGEKDEE